MNFTKVLVAPLALLACVAVSSEAAVVNGLLDDWGITMGTGADVGHLNYNDVYGTEAHVGYQDVHGPGIPEMGTIWYDDRWISFHMEDSSDEPGNHEVGPLFGGQNFDAEFLGVSVVGDQVLIAISSGQRPDNKFARFEPGDIAILSGLNMYGIEVGGGAGDLTKDNGSITGGDPGTTYDLNGSGYVITVHEFADDSDPLTDDQLAGSVWYTPSPADQWRDGIVGPETQLLVGQIVGGIKKGPATAYSYNYSSGLYQHAFIELSVPLSYFMDGVDSVRWSPSCGNDQVLVVDVSGTPPPIPEPASLVVWGLLALVVGGWGWWRRRRVR